VAVEVALALVLLVGAGLMVKAFQGMLRADLGFNTRNLLTMQVVLPERQYREPAGTSAFYDRALRALSLLPEVKVAGAYADKGDPDGFFIEGQPEPRPGEIRPGIRAVSSHYFETLEVPIRRGRGISERDGADSPRVVVLSESVARHYWPEYERGTEPIGRRVKLGNSQSPWLTVVGVSGDIREWPTNPPRATACIPSAQAPQLAMTLAMRTSGDPLAVVPGARAAVRAVDRNPPVYDVKSMEQFVAVHTSGVEAAADTMATYAGIALLLALTGIYALTSYSAAQRTHEIGIRMALGARRGDVLKMVVAQSLRTTGAGLAIGLPVALILTKFMSSVLSDLVPMDLRTVAAFTVLLGGCALLAAYVPARRASRVDPMVALHHE
jgi:predicted permease